MEIGIFNSPFLLLHLFTIEDVYSLRCRFPAEFASVNRKPRTSLIRVIREIRGLYFRRLPFSEVQLEGTHAAVRVTHLESVQLEVGAAGKDAGALRGSADAA